MIAPEIEIAELLFDINFATVHNIVIKYDKYSFLEKQPWLLSNGRLVSKDTARIED